MNEHDAEHHDDPNAEQTSDSHEPVGLSTNRIEALADGVFAVAMTLLVFNVHLPDPNDLKNVTNVNVWGILHTIFIGKGQGPVLIAYVMSFVLLGVYWVSHHAHFQYIRRADRILLWINILFLLLISFVPFTTQLVGIYWNRAGQRLLSQTVDIVYGVHLLCITGVIYLHWWYGTRTVQLTGKRLDPHLIGIVKKRILAAPVFCLAAFALSFLDPRASVVCYLLLPLYYILPGHVDQHWRIFRTPRIAEEHNPEHVGTTNHLKKPEASTSE